MKERKIRFYDNEKFNFIGFSPKKMECILINNHKENILIRKKKYYYKLYYHEYIKKYPFDHEFIRLSIYHNYIIYNEKPPNKGIEKKHIDELNHWVVENKKKEKYIFFDWDRTITVTEGFSYFYNISKKQLNEYLYYLVGGKERFLDLQSLFSFLQKNKVNIYILTNNPTSTGKYRPYFIKLIRLFFPKMKAKNLLYGCKYDYLYDENGNLVKSSKIVLLEKEFPKLFS